jgi:hypothetical protein
MLVSFTYIEMVDKVNARLAKEEQFALLGWHSSKYVRLHLEYKRPYPDGRLLFKARRLTALSFVCIVTCGWGFGIFVT